jgi:hypothetical protein
MPDASILALDCSCLRLDCAWTLVCVNVPRNRSSEAIRRFCASSHKREEHLVLQPREMQPQVIAHRRQGKQSRDSPAHFFSPAPAVPVPGPPATARISRAPCRAPPKSRPNWPQTGRSSPPKRPIRSRARSTADFCPCTPTRRKIASNSASDSDAAPCAKRRSRGRSSSGQSVIAMSSPRVKECFPGLETTCSRSSSSCLALSVRSDGSKSSGLKSRRGRSPHAAGWQRGRVPKDLWTLPAAFPARVPGVWWLRKVVGRAPLGEAPRLAAKLRSWHSLVDRSGKTVTKDIQY